MFNEVDAFGVGVDRNKVAEEDQRMKLRRGLLHFGICLAFLLISLAPHVADARRHRRRSHKKHAAIINEKKLYERLGGAKAVSSIVDEWLRASIADSRIAAFFTPVTATPEKLAKYRRDLDLQICELADGPCSYNGPELTSIQAGAKVEDEQFVAFAEDLVKSLEKFGIAEREKNELLGRIGTMKSETSPDEASTKVGLKKSIEQLSTKQIGK